MEQIARLLNCILCRNQVLICSTCDRGNIYCGPGCSVPARQESMRAAGARYQNSYKGRLKHAARQKRYREREKQKVTHLGSKSDPAPSSSITPDTSTLPGLTAPRTELRCDFCGSHVTDLLRNNFLDRSSRAKVVVKTSCAQGP